MWIFEHNFVADKAKILAGLSTGKYFLRRMQQNFSKRYVDMLKIATEQNGHLNLRCNPEGNTFSLLLFREARP